MDPQRDRDREIAQAEARGEARILATLQKLAEQWRHYAETNEDYPTTTTVASRYFAGELESALKRAVADRARATRRGDG